MAPQYFINKILIPWFKSLKFFLQSGWNLIQGSIQTVLVPEHLAPLSIFLPLLILILWPQIPFSLPLLYLHE